jgi:hypothetical protein
MVVIDDFEYGADWVVNGLKDDRGDARVAWMNG